MANGRESEDYVAEDRPVLLSCTETSPLRNIVTSATYDQRCCMQHLWSHTRRTFERAKDAEPEAVAEALALIGAMYAHEEQIRADALTGEDKRAYRQTHTRPVVETFWRWCREQCHRPELLPKSPLAKALNYAQERRSGLEVFLDDPAVAIDTNHLERALRPIPLGKRNWLFASSEVGAQRVGIIQTLLVTCRLHEVDAYTYLIDVLQRISMHPANRAIELTPRM